MRSEEELRAAIEQYEDTVRRLCMIHLKNEADTQDIIQNVFLKYLLRHEAFESPEHEKAWFIRVTLNACKDLIKSVFRNRTVPLEALATYATNISDDAREVLSAVMALPQGYRDVVYLHYYEGYTVPEIGALLGKNKNTIYTHLTRARQQLREMLGDDRNG